TRWPRDWSSDVCSSDLYDDRISPHNPKVAGWLRGLDLNQRPLGYEGKSGRHSNQEKPTAPHDDEDLGNNDVGAFWFASVGVLHRHFIARRLRTPGVLAFSREHASSST